MERFGKTASCRALGVAGWHDEQVRFDQMESHVGGLWALNWRGIKEFEACASDYI